MTQENKPFQKPILFAAEVLVKTSQLPESAQAWLESNLVSGMSSIASLWSLNPDGFYLRTSPAYSAPMTGKTLQSFLQDLPESYQVYLQKDGETPDLRVGDPASTAWLGGVWTLNISTSHSAARVSSLLAILETDVLPKYFLSAKAARGILLRAKKRGKTLPPPLEQSLQAVVMAAVLQHRANSLYTPPLSRERWQAAALEQCVLRVRRTKPTC